MLLFLAGSWRFALCFLCCILFFCCHPELHRTLRSWLGTVPCLRLVTPLCLVGGHLHWSQCYSRLGILVGSPGDFLYSLLGFLAKPPLGAWGKQFRWLGLQWAPCLLHLPSCKGVRFLHALIGLRAHPLLVKIGCHPFVLLCENVMALTLSSMPGFGFRHSSIA